VTNEKPWFLELHANLLDHDAQHTRPLAEVPVLVVPHPFILGGESGYRISLLELVTTPFDGDVHYAQYVSNEDARLRKDMQPSNLAFRLVAIDLDGPEHQDPGDDAWWTLVQTTAWMRPQPNIVHRTRAGARLIYLIEPITEAGSFELRRIRLLGEVKKELGERPSHVLDATPDWTRLIRAPLVVRRNDDGTTTDLRGMPVWVWHAGRIDLGKKRWEPNEIPTREKHGATEPRPYSGKDRVIERYLATQHHPGSRNDSLFSVACWCWKNYVEEDAQRLIEQVAAHARDEGLSEHETESIAKSARLAVERERSADAGRTG
jgi:hypothetical protein